MNNEITHKAQWGEVRNAKDSTCRRSEGITITLIEPIAIKVTHMMRLRSSAGAPDSITTIGNLHAETYN